MFIGELCASLLLELLDLLFTLCLQLGQEVVFCGGGVEAAVVEEDREAVVFIYFAVITDEELSDVECRVELELVVEVKKSKRAEEDLRTCALLIEA